MFFLKIKIYIYSFLFLLLIVFLLKYFSPKRIVGRKGERKAKRLIRKVLDKEDLLLSNVKIEFDGKRSEIDDLIVTRKGIFIIEVKNFSGKLIGKIDDEKWIKEKESYRDTFSKEIRNPIKQVNREIYILSNILRKKQIYSWIDGAIFLINDNPGIYDSKILRNVNEVNNFIHKRDNKTFSNKEFEDIKEVIRSL